MGQRQVVMKQKTSQTLFSYWNEVRAERIAPRRFEIEPSRIAAVLPDTFILECTGSSSYRFRLAGTRICELFGCEFRGVDLLDFFADQDRALLECVLGCVTKQAPVAVIAFDAVTREGESARFEMLILPLLHTHDKIARFLGSISPLEHPAWLGHMPPWRQKLVSHELVWPDGRPVALLQKLQRQNPFAPEDRNVRIVTSERRRFRVFQGGRAGPDDPQR